MSSYYDSNMNSNYNSFIESTPHMSLSITLSDVGHLNCHSLTVTSQGTVSFNTNPDFSTNFVLQRVMVYWRFH